MKKLLLYVCLMVLSVSWSVAASVPMPAGCVSAGVSNQAKRIYCKADTTVNSFSIGGSAIWKTAKLVTRSGDAAYYCCDGAAKKGCKMRGWIMNRQNGSFTCPESFVVPRGCKQYAKNGSVNRYNCSVKTEVARSQHAVKDLIVPSKLVVSNKNALYCCLGALPASGQCKNRAAWSGRGLMKCLSA